LYAVSDNGRWTKPAGIDRGAFSAGGKRAEGEAEPGILLFFLSLREPPLDRRRSALTADAYEADVKTFVKYEGTASRKIDSSAPSRTKGRPGEGQRIVKSR